MYNYIEIVGEVRKKKVMEERKYCNVSSSFGKTKIC